MRRPDAEQATEAGRHADRTAGIRPQGKVANPASHRRRGSAGRPARHPIRRAWIDRRAGVGVFPQDPQRHLVRRGLADDAGTGLQQPVHDPGMRSRYRVCPLPVRIAAAGRHPGNVDQILDREGQAIERAPRLSPDRTARTGNERVQGILRHVGLAMRLTWAATIRHPCGIRTQDCICRPILPGAEARSNNVDAMAKSRP